MIQRNILQLCIFLALYYLLYYGYPSLCLGWKLKELGYRASERGLIYLVSASAAYTFLGYILAALGLLRTIPILIILVLLALVFFSMRGGYAHVRSYWNHNLKKWLHLSEGTMSLRLYSEQKMHNMWRNVGHWIFTRIICHPFHFLAIAVFLGVFCYSRFYPMIVNDWYGQPDMYVHLSWADAIAHGEIYPRGIYPEAMHVDLLFLTRLFRLDLTHVIKYWGAVNALNLLFCLRCLMHRCFKSSTSAIVTVWIIFCSGLVTDGSLERLAFSLPQEYGWAFMLAAGCFLLDYLSQKQKRYLVLLGAAFAMTVMIHFYVTIVTALLLIAIAIFHFKTVFSKKHFWKLAATAILSLLVAVSPFLVAAAAGEEWNGSINWALSVMSGGEQQHSHGEDVESGQHLPEPDEGGIGEENPESQGKPLDKIRKYLRTRRLSFYDVLEMSWTGKLYMGLMGAAVLLLIWRLSRKKWDSVCAAQYSVLLFGVFIWLLLILDVERGISLIPLDRLRLSLAIGLTIGVMIPLDALLDCCGHAPGVWQQVSTGAVQLSLLGFFAWVLVGAGLFMGFGSAFQSEYNPTVRLIDQLKKEKEDFSWTVVTTTPSLYRIKNNGYHMETWEFIHRLEEDSPSLEVHIPTQYVYFVVEKQTLSQSHAHLIKDAPVDGIKITEEMGRDRTLYKDPRAKNSPYDYFYNDEGNRAVLNSKFYLWAKQFGKSFPKEMIPVYEDEYQIIYRFKQEVNTAANFAIPYWDEAMMEETLR